MEVFALDLGNIQTKIKSSKRNKVLPSKFIKYSRLGNQQTSISASTKDIKEYKVEFDDRAYAWGTDINEAKGVKRFLDTIAFEDRYSKSNFRLLATFAIGELAQDFPESKNGMLEVKIVTGVPTDEFNEKDVKNIMNILDGVHTITIDGVTSIVRVNEVKVLPQPVGTVYNELLDREGYIAKEEYEDETVSVVDCGGGTVLIDTLNHMSLSETGRTQEESGAHSLYEDIIADCSNESIRITKNEVEKILKYQKEKYVFKPNKDESIDITDKVIKNIEDYTDEILNIVDSTLKGSSHIDTLLFTGGGSNIINKKEIKNVYERAIFIKNSETANVNGFYKYGLATTDTNKE